MFIPLYPGDVEVVLGQPSHSAGYDLASFWSQKDGECERQYAVKTEAVWSQLFRLEKLMWEISRKEYWVVAGEGPVRHENADGAFFVKSPRRTDPLQTA